MANRRKGKTGDDGPSTNWMDTYGDMVTLLLTFFVMLFAMSTIDVSKFEKIIKSIRGSMGLVYQGQSLKKADLMADNSTEYEVKLNEVIQKVYPQRDIKDVSQSVEDMKKSNDDMEEIYIKIKEYLKDKQIDDLIIVNNEQIGIIIRFKENFLFDSGKAIIKQDAKQLMADISGILNTIDRDIRVEGHTDNVPIHNSSFASNWELSAQRAANVVKFFIENDIDPLRLSLAGYSEYHPVADNSTKEGRQKNRRVDVLILRYNNEELISAQEEGSD